MEKTPRSVNVPFVVNSTNALSYIIFHTRLVHLMSVSKRGSIESFSGTKNSLKSTTGLNGCLDYLLLNTQTGLPLCTKQIGASWQKFV